MGLDVTWHSAEGGKMKCELNFDDVGVHLKSGRQTSWFGWQEIHRLSFDDPGRTKASVGYIAVFGVAGLAKRVAYTMVTLTSVEQDVYFEAKVPLSICRTFAHRVLLQVPAARGLIFIDGNELTVDTNRAPSSPAAWYPDPDNNEQLRYFDGFRWTDHYAQKT